MLSITNVKDYDSDIILAFHCEGLLALYPAVRHCFFNILRLLFAILHPQGTSSHSERHTAVRILLGRWHSIYINKQTQRIQLPPCSHQYIQGKYKFCHAYSNFVLVLLFLLWVHSHTSTQLNKLLIGLFPKYS